MNEPGWTREEAVALLRSGLADAMKHAAAMYVMPVCWITARDGRPAILDNGSAFLLDCGEGPFLVTARHVRQGFLADRQKRPDAVCLVGGTRFDLAGRLIDSDPAYDVATFRVDATSLRA